MGLHNCAKSHTLLRVNGVPIFEQIGTVGHGEIIECNCSNMNESQALVAVCT